MEREFREFKEFREFREFRESSLNSLISLNFPNLLKDPQKYSHKKIEPIR